MKMEKIGERWMKSAKGKNRKDLEGLRERFPFLKKEKAFNSMLEAVERGIFEVKNGLLIPTLEFMFAVQKKAGKSVVEILQRIGAEADRKTLDDTLRKQGQLIQQQIPEAIKEEAKARGLSPEAMITFEDAGMLSILTRMILKYFPMAVVRMPKMKGVGKVGN